MSNKPNDVSEKAQTKENEELVPMLDRERSIKILQKKRRIHMK